jgi:hypothetical protein
MLTRDEFLALLARLRGDGEALTAAELAAMAAYASHHAAADAEAREAITDDELAEVEASLMALGESDDLPLDALEAAVDAVEGVRTVAEGRIEADAAAAAEAARLEQEAAQRRQELRDRLAGPQASDAGDGDGDAADAGDGDDGQADADGDGGDAGDDAGEGGAGGDGDDAGAAGDAEGADDREPVGATAAAGTRRSAPQRIRRTAGDPAAARRTERRGNRILRDASRGGGEFADLAELGQAMFETRQRMLHANNGVSEMMVLGAVEAEYPDDHVLDPYRSVEQLQALSAAAAAGMGAEQYDAQVAAGGFCAPTEPYYGIMALATAGRPFRGSFPQRNAARGRILFRTPPDFPDFAGAVSQWTETNDTTPGSDGPATKPCLVVPCSDTDEAEVYAVTECLTFGNFMARTDPETIANAVVNTAAAFARKADTLLIDAVKAASTAVTAGDALGAYRDLSYQIRVAAAGFRSRHRMDPNAVLELRLPAWSYDLVLADLVRSLPGDGTLDAGRDLFNRALAAANVRLAGLYIDSPTTGVPQVFGPQNAGGLVDFPAAVQWHLTAPGSFVVLDNGRLDLGVVRDSILNRTNDYQTFAETFEGIAFLGLESLWVTSTVCPNGASSGTVDPSAFCGGDYVPA